MIVIKSHHHTKNSGFGNKLFLTSFAESYAIETGQPVFNWLVTDILHGGDRDGVLSKDNKGVEWRHLPNIAVNDEEASIVGKGTNLSSHDFHQTANDIELIKKYKNYGTRNKIPNRNNLYYSIYRYHNLWIWNSSSYPSHGYRTTISLDFIK